MTVSHTSLTHDEPYTCQSDNSSEQVAHRRNLIWQRYGEGNTPAEIAVEAGMSEKQVRKILLDNGKSASVSIGGVDSIWELEDNQRRVAFARRAQRGARKALGKRDRLDKPGTPPAAAQSAPAPVQLPPMPNWLRIASEVSARHKLSIKELTGPGRQRYIVVARNEAFWRIREETKLSFPQIGAKFGRDHTTVLHGYHQHAKRLAAHGGIEQ